jgi:hypothetical protein
MKVRRLPKSYWERSFDTGSVGRWAVPCDTTAPLSLFFKYAPPPKVVILNHPDFYSSGRNYTVDPSDYLIGPTSGNPNLCLAWPHASPPSSDGIDWQIGQSLQPQSYRSSGSLTYF